MSVGCGGDVSHVPQPIFSGNSLSFQGKDIIIN